MSGLDIMEALGGINERYVFEAKHHSRKRSSFGKWALIAACFVCVLLVGVLHLKNPATDPVDASPAAMAPGLEEFGQNVESLRHEIRIKLENAEDADNLTEEQLSEFEEMLVDVENVGEICRKDTYRWLFDIGDDGISLRVLSEDGSIVLLISLPKETKETTPPERLTGPDPETVTIAVEQQMLDNLPVEEIARRFEAEYPNTRVEFISILTDNTAYGDADLVDQVGIWETALSENPGIDIVMSNGTITSLLGGKGLLADLEQELDLSDLLPNLRAALKGDGGVYILPNYLSVMTYYGKTQWLGDVDTLYAEDLLELAQNPDVPLYAVSMEGASLLISDMASKFMNPAEGKVNFDNEEFRTMLELAQYLYHDPRYANPLDNDIRNDIVQLNICQVFTLQELYEIEHYFVDADIAFCGLYGAKNGYFELFNTFALTKNGAESDMNSEFLQFCLRDEIQALWGRMGIPVTDSALENQFAMFETNSVFYATGEDSYTVHADEDVVYQYQPMTRAQFEEYRDWLLGVDTVDYGDARLHNVITQEISKFLSGEQPLDETVAVIQEQAELAFGIIFE